MEVYFELFIIFIKKKYINIHNPHTCTQYNIIHQLGSNTSLSCGIYQTAGEKYRDKSK